MALRHAAQRHASGEIDAAAQIYRQVLAIQPDCYDALRLLAVALRQRGQVEPALVLLRQAIALAPQMAPAYCDLGECLRDCREIEEAASSFATAARLAPAWASPLVHLGVMEQANGRPDRAATAFTRALAIDPANLVALNNLAMLLAADHQYERATQLLENALKITPNSTETLSNLGAVYLEQGQVEPAISVTRAAVNAAPGPSRAAHNLLHALLYSDRITPGEVFAEHAAWGRQFPPPSSSHTNTRDPHRRLRIGYVSPDFRRHPLAMFIEPVLARHDPRQFHITCYSDAPFPDEITQRLRQHPQQWRNTARLSTNQFTDLIQSDTIDIFVDLSVHGGDNRLSAFALKPAPVQITWLGYAHTTGLPAIDYRVTDAHVDPLGKTEHLHTESLLRLPQTLWCYQPPPETQDKNGDAASFKLAASPFASSIPQADVTFGSFNRLAKLSDSALLLWAQILHQVPHSRLSLMAAGLGDEATRCQIRARSATAGIDPSRLILHLPASAAEYYRHLASLDIALDPFPFNGGATTCNALWMGVPVVTLAGAAPISRVGVSILTNVGLPELIAHDPHQYVAIAVALAQDHQRRHQLRVELRNRMAHSPLCDSANFVAHLEAAYRHVWQTWCGRAPT
jgi:protein O-GlcNAc transferase